MKKKITKVVIPAAGYGTRFLPATKSMPKEMLAIVDKPIIQYVVEEAVASGIKDVIIITGWHKRAIEDYFDYPFELEKRLEEAGKIEELKEVRRIAEMANFIYIRQKGRYGNATPALCAKDVVGNEPFAVIWGDEFIYAEPPRLKQMIEVYEEYQAPVISGVRIEKKKELSRYGIARIKPVKDNIHQILEIVEKPEPDKAPSNLATHGAYILPPETFSIIENLKPGKGGEIWLIDAINVLMKKGPVYACEIQNGKYYDASNKLGYLKANVEFALKNAAFKKEFAQFLKATVNKL
jgi:UTP--glucose-1-phosphate uridylyltransferase